MPTSKTRRGNGGREGERVPRLKDRSRSSSKRKKKGSSAAFILRHIEKAPKGKENRPIGKEENLGVVPDKRLGRGRKKKECLLHP